MLPKAQLISRSQPKMAESFSVMSEPSIMPTGIMMLDRTIGGGLPEGSLVYISADPKSMCEVFLYQFSQSSKTYYFTTERKPMFVARDIRSLNFDISNINFIDVYSEYYITPQGEMVDNVGNEFVDAKIIEFTEYNLRKIQLEAEHNVVLIIDSFSFYLSLNVNQGRLRRLANIIYEISKEIDSLTYLYALKDTHDKKLENEILKEADVVFDVELDKRDEKLINRLSIPKIRGKVPSTDMIKFKVEDGVQIDTTCDIA